MLNICQDCLKFLWLIILILLCFPCGHLTEIEIKETGKQKGLEGRDKDPDGKKAQPGGMAKTKMQTHSFNQTEKHKDRRTHSLREATPREINIRTESSYSRL